MDLSRLGIRGKLAALVAAPAAPLLGGGIVAIYLLFGTYGAMQELGASVELAMKAGDLLYESQKERGMSAGHLGSKGASFGPQLDEQRTKFDTAAEALRPSFDMEVGGPVQERLSSVAERLEGVAEMRQRVSALGVPVGKAVRFYTGINKDLLAVVNGVAKSAKATDVAALATALGAVMRFTEYGGIERAVLANTFARGRFGPGMWGKLHALMALQDENRTLFEAFATPALLERYGELMSEDITGPVERMRELARASGGTEAIVGGDASKWFAAQTAKLDRLRAVQLEVAAEIRRRAENHASTASLHLAELAAGLVIVLALTGLFAYLLMKNISGPVDELSDLMETVENTAVFADRLPVRGTDELSRAGAAFNGLLDQLETTVDEVQRVSAALGRGELDVETQGEARGRFQEINDGLSRARDSFEGLIVEVKNAVRELGHAVGETQSSSTRLAAHASELTAATSSSLAATEETDSMVRANTQSVAEANAKVAETAEVAHRGREKMEGLEQAIANIAANSDRIVKAIDGIDEIAFQTSILAIQATVEAARAGVQGRGFAVVAQEVQSLANRSAAAAQASSELLAEAKTSVAEGVETARATSEVFTSIIDDVMEIKNALAEVAHASDEQRVGVSELSKSIQEINESANALDREGGSLEHQSRALTRMTAALQEAVTTFRVRGESTSLPVQATPPAPPSPDSRSDEVQPHV